MGMIRMEHEKSKIKHVLKVVDMILNTTQE
jgi:hypothetical protein